MGALSLTHWGSIWLKVMKRVLCIGTCSKPQQSRCTGQSVMFDGMVHYFSQEGMAVDVLDISTKIMIKGAFFRALDYFLIICKLFFLLCKREFNFAYIISSQSRRGFFRDNVMISMCRKFNIPVIAHQYGANYRQLTDRLGERGMSRLKKMLGSVKAIIVEGDYMKTQFSFLPDYMSKVHVVPNGLPIEGEERARRPKEYRASLPFYLLYLSNLIWSKGYFDVLRAVDILINRENLNVKCIFAGRFMSSIDDERSGISNKKDFDEFIERHQIADSVEYYQGLYGKEKDAAFSKANSFVLPTYYINEGQPVSVIEAMAYGCVPIVTNYRHIPMMVNEQNGCFVSPKNPESLVSEVKSLINNPDIYAAKSRQSIIDYKHKFTFDVYVSKVMNCVDSVIK